jgi:hypothetical protein
MRTRVRWRDLGCRRSVAVDLPRPSGNSKISRGAKVIGDHRLIADVAAVMAAWRERPVPGGATRGATRSALVEPVDMITVGAKNKSEAG